MAEYVKNIAEEDRWEKMNDRTNAVFEKIMEKLEILLHLSSHGATNSVKASHASESLNVVMPTHDEFLPSVKQIKIPSPCTQSLLVDAVNPASDLIEDVMDLPATTTITTLTETTELFAGHNISIDQVEFSLSTESADTLFVTDEESVGQLDTDELFLEIQGSHPKRGLQFNQIDLESSTEPIHLISPQEPQDRKTILECICMTKLPCLGMMWTGSIQKCISRVRRNVSMQSGPLKPPDRNHRTMANPPPPPEPPDMSSHVFVITLPMIAKVLKFSTCFITFGENFVWTADMLAISHDIEKSNIQNNSLSVGSCLMECIKSLLEKHKIIWGLSLDWVFLIGNDFICVIGSKYLVLAATHRSVIHAYKLFVKFPNRDVVIWSTLFKSGTSFCSTNVASYFFMVMVLKSDHYTLFVCGLYDIHFSNYNVCHDVELVSTATLSHVKGSLQIPNESIGTKLRHQATQLCGNTAQLIEKLQATLNTNVLLHNCGVYDMSKMILDCSHSLILEYIKTCLLERKLLPSFEIVSKCWMVVVMQVDYGDFDLMRLNCGCVYSGWRLKKTNITSCSSTIVLSQFNLIHHCLWTAHLSSWLHKFNIQGGIGDSYGLGVLVEHVFYNFCANFEDLNDENKGKNEAYILGVIATHVECLLIIHKKFKWQHVGIRMHLMFVATVYANQFHVIIVRLGLLFCVVNSDLQWCMNSQSLYFSKTNIYGMCVVLLKDILGSNYLASPLDMCKRVVRQLELSVDPFLLYYSISEWIHIYLEHFGEKSFSAVTLLLSKGGSVVCYKLASWIKDGKNWDPGGNDYFSRLKCSFHFKQWDPGGCYLVNKECSLDLERLEKLFTSFNTVYLGSNLEDKVDFKGEGIVMNLPNWTGPNKS